jgi:hypothetical protein
MDKVTSDNARASWAGNTAASCSADSSAKSEFAKAFSQEAQSSSGAGQPVCSDPTAPTAREQAAQQSLAQNERQLPPSSSDGAKAGENPGNGRAAETPTKPFNPGGLNGFQQALDGIVNPNAAEHPVLAGAMNNMAARGEGLVKGFEQRVNDRAQIAGALAKGHVVDAVKTGAKQLGGEVAGIATGFAHSVKTAGNALGDIAYYGTHSDEAGAKEKIGSAVVDGVLEGANIITTVDGAAGLAKGGAAALGGCAAAQGAKGAAAQAGRSVENGAAGAARNAENGAVGAGGRPPGSPGEGSGSGGHGGPNNAVGDVATFEARQAAFEAGKNMERGSVTARANGADLPPPRGAQLDKIAANTPEGTALRKTYASKQGMEAGKALQENVATRSEAAAANRSVVGPPDPRTPNFGDASGRLVPEMGFKDGAIHHVNKYPGGSPAGSRTLDLGVAKEPIAPSDWQGLVGQKGGDALSGGYDLKVGGGYVKDKPGFRTVSGGVDPKEIRPFTPGLKR